MRKVKGALLSLGMATAAGMALLALTSLVIGKTGNLPQGTVTSVLVTVVVCVAVFVGSLIASLFTGEKGILLGGTCGLFFVCCVVVGALISGMSVLSVGGGARLAAIFISGCIGGILGVNHKQKVKF